MRVQHVTIEPPRSVNICVYVEAYKNININLWVAVMKLELWFRLPHRTLNNWNAFVGFVLREYNQNNIQVLLSPRETFA